MENPLICPFKKGLECWNYSPDCSKNIDREPYFGTPIHKSCNKLNDAFKADIKKPIDHKLFKTLEEDLDNAEEMVYLAYGNNLTDSEIDLIKRERIENLEESYLKTGKVHEELLDYTIKKFEDEYY